MSADEEGRQMLPNHLKAECIEYEETITYENAFPISSKCQTCHNKQNLHSVYADVLFVPSSVQAGWHQDKCTPIAD